MDTLTNSTLSQGFDFCVYNIKSRIIFVTWFTVYLTFLPIFLFVLHIGYKKWKKSQSSTPGNISHSDIFTFNMVAMELISVVGSCVGCYGFFRKNIQLTFISAKMIVTTSTGQVLFHSLTSGERYLAVVHPITYMKLRNASGVNIRNISIVIVWISSGGFSLIVSMLKDPVIITGLELPLYATLMLFVSFCSSSVLCVLIRPKPGERGGERRQVDQSKRSTVYTMVAIMGVLLLRLAFYVAGNIIYFSREVEVDVCVLTMASLCSCLPSSLVLPLLFLCRAGKLHGCK